mgnify:CR=1 FL=1
MILAEPKRRETAMAKNFRTRKTMLEVLREQDIVLAPGAYDVMSARLIEQSGCPLVYLSGLANEASDLGYPDLGFTTAAEIVRRRVAASVGDALAGTLPKLAPADVRGLTAWLKNCPAPTSEVAAC